MRDNDLEKSPSPEEAGPNKKSRSRSASNSSQGSKKSLRSRSPRSSSKSRSRSRSRSSEIDGYRLHIADIGDDMRKSDLEKIFSPYGELKEVWMTNSSPCFGFAVFKDKKCAGAALKATDGIEINGNRIRVTYARPRTRGSGRRYYNSNMRCYQCGYTGHFYRDCPEVNGGGGGGGGDKRDRGYDSHYDRSRRHRDRGRDHYRDYDRDNDRRHRSSRRYDDYNRSSRRSSRRHRY